MVDTTTPIHQGIYHQNQKQDQHRPQQQQHQDQQQHESINNWWCRSCCDYFSIILGIFNRVRPRMKPTILCLAITSFILSTLGIFKCNFIIVRIQIANYKQTLGIGLFSRSVYDTDGDVLGCVRFTDNDTINGMIWLGRTFGVLTAFFTAVALVFTVSTIVFCPTKRRERLWIIMRYQFAMATISQMFAFFPLGGRTCESLSCGLGATGVAALVNVIILGLISVLVFLEPAPTVPWITVWSPVEENEDLAATKDSLASVDHGTGGSMSEFVSSMEASSTSVFTPPNIQMGNEHLSTKNTAQILGGDGITGGILPRKKGSLVSDHSIHHHDMDRFSEVSGGSNLSKQSIQESLSSTIGIQGNISFRLGSVAAVAVSWALSLMGMCRCTLILIGPVGGENSAFSALGLFSRAMYNSGEIIGCLDYSDDAKGSFDDPFQAARVFGPIAAFLLSCILLLATVQLLVRIAKDEIWFVLRALLPCALIAELLVFVAMKTETCTVSQYVECRPGGTGWALIVNAILLFSLSVASFLVPPPPGPVLRICREAAHGADETTVTNQSSERGSEIGSSSLKDLPPRIRQKSGRRIAPSLDGAESTGGETGDTTVVHENGRRRADPPIEMQNSTLRIRPQPVESISVRVEYVGNEKKTIKTLINPDGSKTVTTTIEELMNEYDTYDDYNYDDDDDDDTHVGSNSVVDDAELSNTIKLSCEDPVEAPDDKYDPSRLMYNPNATSA